MKRDADVTRNVTEDVVSVTTAKQVYLAGIEATEAERIAWGAPPGCDDLRRELGLPSRRAHPTPADTDLAAARATAATPKAVTMPLPDSEQGLGHVTATTPLEPALDSEKTALQRAIADLAGRGLSTRRIVDALALKGFWVSHMTVARYLRAGR